MFTTSHQICQISRKIFTAHFCSMPTFSGPVLRDTARLSQRYPPIARYGVFWCLNFAPDGVRARFRQAVKVPIFGGFPIGNPTKKANRLKALQWMFLSEYGSEGLRVRLRRLSEYGSVAYLVERPARETQAEQYSDTVLLPDGCDTPSPFSEQFPPWRAFAK